MASSLAKVQVAVWLSPVGGKVAGVALWDGSLQGKSSLIDLCRTWFLVAWRRPELEALLGWDWGLSWLMCSPSDPATIVVLVEADLGLPAHLKASKRLMFPAYNTTCVAGLAPQLRGWRFLCLPCECWPGSCWRCGQVGSVLPALRAEPSTCCLVQSFSLP